MPGLRGADGNLFPTPLSPLQHSCPFIWVPLPASPLLILVSQAIKF